MIRIIFSLSVLLLIIGCSTSKNNTSQIGVLEFPVDYCGVWSGSLHLHNNKKSHKNLQMTLEVLPLSDSTYHWNIIYKDDTHVDRREYILVVQDPSAGEYIIDEKNSILLPLQQYGDRLVSWFKIGGQELVISYTLNRDLIDFRVDVGRSTAEKKTGGGIQGVDTIPEVTIVEVLASQSAQLRKVNKKTLSMD